MRIYFFDCDKLVVEVFEVNLLIHGFNFIVCLLWYLIWQNQYLTSDGEIKTGLLVLNFQSGAQANVATMDFTIASVVLTHEIGHVIGIGLSSDTNALMYYATGAGRNNVLSKDDIDAVTYLYPSKEAPGGLSCAQVSSKNHTGWSNAMIELFFMMLALYF